MEMQIPKPLSEIPISKSGNGICESHFNHILISSLGGSDRGGLMSSGLESSMWVQSCTWRLGQGRSRS